MDDDDLERVKIEIEDLSEALGKARLPKSITTFRGIAPDRAVRYRNLKPGQIVADPGFYSSSLSVRTAEWFGGFQIEARLQEGAPGIALIHFVPHVNLVEYEVLIDAGAKMRVVEVLADKIVVEILAK